MTFVLWFMFNVIIKLVQRDLFNKYLMFNGIVSWKLQVTWLYLTLKEEIQSSKLLRRCRNSDNDEDFKIFTPYVLYTRGNRCRNRLPQPIASCLQYGQPVAATSAPCIHYGQPVAAVAAIVAATVASCIHGINGNTEEKDIVRQQTVPAGGVAALNILIVRSRRVHTISQKRYWSDRAGDVIGASNAAQLRRKGTLACWARCFGHICTYLKHYTIRERRLTNVWKVCSKWSSLISIFGTECWTDWSHWSR
jgi:hypothetical protein